MGKLSLRNSIFLILLAVAFFSAILHSTYIHSSKTFDNVDVSPHLYNLRLAVQSSKEQSRDQERQFVRDRMNILHGLHESRAHREAVEPQQPDLLDAEKKMNIKGGEAIPPAFYLRSQAQIFNSFHELPTQPPRMHAIINKERAKEIDGLKNAEWNAHRAKFVDIGGGIKVRDCIHKCLDVTTCKQAECVRAVSSQALCDQCIFEYYDAGMVKSKDDLAKEEKEAAQKAAELLEKGYREHKGSAICGLSCSSKNVNCHNDIKQNVENCKLKCDHSKKCHMFQPDPIGFGGVCITFDFPPKDGYVDGDIKHTEFCVGPTYVKARQ